MVTLTVSPVSGNVAHSRTSHAAKHPGPGSQTVADSPGRPAAPVSGQAQDMQVSPGAAPSVPALVSEPLRAEPLSLSTRHALAVFARVAAAGDKLAGQAELAGIDIVV